jgi:hypothetical protein
VKAELVEYLIDINRKGRIQFSTLIDSRGEIIASSENASQPSSIDPTTAALIQALVGRVSDRLGLTQVDAISLQNALGERLLCCRIDVNDESITLAIRTSTHNHCRRWANHVIQATARLLKDCAGCPDKYC